MDFEQEEENLTRRFPRERAVGQVNEIQKLKKEGHNIAEIKEILR